MNELFVKIAQYMFDKPECKKKTAYAIYNEYFSQYPYAMSSLKDVKMVIDYIDSLKNTPTNLLADALQGGV